MTTAASLRHAVRVDRLESDLTALSAFSGSGDGVTRPAWSDQYLEARNWLAERAREAGLTVTVDPIGNLWADWPTASGTTSEALVVGSHIDTVPHAGRFDGCLGVLGGLEAIRVLREAGFRPTRPIRLVAWIEEEGTATGRTLLGSSVFTGEVDPTDARQWPGHSDVLARLLEKDDQRAPNWSKHSVEHVDTYLELHIEQGPVLHRDGIQIGVVSGIVGCRSGTVQFRGVGNHAGTTPMDSRHDALVVAAKTVCVLRELALSLGVTATVGKVHAEPNAANVIPALVELSYDIRSLDDALLDRYLTQALATVENIAALEGVEVTVPEQTRIEAVHLDESLRHRIEKAACELGLSTMHLPSGALHDAAPVARRVPTAMIFVPSVDGVSHAPAEFTEPEDCVSGVAVLAELIRQLG